MSIKTILGLKEPLTVDDLKPLIGKEFSVNRTDTEWGKLVVVTDKLVVTSISMAMDVETGKGKLVHIYSDYWLKGVKKYNAWTGLKSFQSYLQTPDTSPEGSIGG